MPDLDIIPLDERCDFCRRKPATKLCDYPVGERASPHMVIKYGKRITCDAKMCDDCATSLGYEMDFCPKCMEELKNLK
ncbi:MAG: hypothetical protein H6Q72_933 [Firmicutes bacterium]|nr:hypothetical protein [Bacillota bacterium]